MTTRRDLLVTLAGLMAGNVACAAIRPLDLDLDRGLVKIGFGSCVSQREEQHIWSSILEKQPDLFLLLGDGVYPEHEGEELPVLESIERAYAHAATRQEMADFRSKVKTVAMWDDNDYGGSDIGKTFAHKQRSRDLFLDFWCDEIEAEIRRRDSGIYGLWEFGKADRRIQLIVPDLRYSRSEWAQTEESVHKELGDSGFGPYKPLLGDNVSMLGEQQWSWLESCLKRPAHLRIIVSSIQLIPEGRGWESWSNFPAEKQKLFELIDSAAAEGVIIVSGDSHYGEVSYDAATGIGYPLWEITSSGMTEVWPVPGPNPARVGPAYPVRNFGLITVNWLTKDPIIVTELFDDNGDRLRQLSLQLSSLRRNS